MSKTCEVSDEAVGPGRRLKEVSVIERKADFACGKCLWSHSFVQTDMLKVKMTRKEMYGLEILGRSFLSVDV